MAFRAACAKAAPAIMEPVMKIEIVSPDEFVGAAINDLNSRRGRVLGVSAQPVNQLIDAEAPLSEMFGYATQLRSLSQGRSSYTMQFSRYMQTSASAQDAILRKIGRLI